MSPVTYGDPEVALRNEILRSEVGSGVHGIAIAGTDDHDEMGVYVEPPRYLFTVDEAVRHDYTSRTADEGQRSKPGDTDLVLYSLRRYLTLAAKGNPTVLLPLFAPPRSVIACGPLGHELRSMRDHFLSQHAVHRFLGYMESQYERMMGLQNKHTPNRPELIEKHGWDTKYGSHALRLAYQGREIAFNHTLTLPLEPDTRELVLSVKRGEVPRDKVSAEILRIGAEIQALLDSGKTGLPEDVDGAFLAAWSESAHLRHWGLDP